MRNNKLPPAVRKVFWFIGLWAASLLFFVLLAYGLRMIIGSFGSY